MDISESSWSGCQIFHGLLRYVSGMIIQDDPYSGFGGIVSVHFFQQGDKFYTTMFVRELGRSHGRHANPKLPESTGSPSVYIHNPSIFWIGPPDQA